MYSVLAFSFIPASAGFAGLLDKIREAVDLPEDTSDRIQDKLAALGLDDEVADLQDAGEDLLDRVDDKLEDWKDNIKDGVDAIKETLDFDSDDVEDLRDDAQDFFDEIGDAADDFRDDLREVAEDAMDDFDDTMDDFGDAAEDFRDDLQEAAEDFADDAREAFDDLDVEGLQEQAGDAVKAAAGELREAMNGAWEGIKDMSIEAELLFGLDDGADPIKDLSEVIEKVMPKTDGRRRRVFPDGLPIPQKWRGTPQGGWVGALGLSDELTRAKECLIYFKDAKFVPGVFEPYMGGWMCRNKRTKRVEDVYMAVGVKGCIPMSNSMYTNNGVVEINLITQRIDVCDAALMAATAGMSKVAASQTLKLMGKQSTRFQKFLNSERFVDKLAKRKLEGAIKKQVKGAITPKYDHSAGGCKQLGSLLTAPFSSAIRSLDMLVCFLENLGRGNGAARGAANTLKGARDALNKIKGAMEGLGVGDALNKLSDAMYIQFAADQTTDLNTLNLGVKLTFELKYDVLGLYKAAIASACEVTSTWRNVCNKIKKACGPFAFFCGWVTQCHWEQITRPLTDQMVKACRYASGLLGNLPNTAIHVKETIPITSGRLVQRSGIWAAFDVIAIAPPTASDGAIQAGQGSCPEGYVYHAGDVPGWGRIGSSGGGQRLNNEHDCRNKCDAIYQCNSFEWSPTAKKCNLNTRGKPTQGPYLDYWFCEKACVAGFSMMRGDVPHWGKVNGVGGGVRVGNCNQCGLLCKQQGGYCKSYECSTTERRCNLNVQNKPTVGPYKNYLFCSKNLCASGYTWKNGDYPGWGSVNGVGRGRRVGHCDDCAALCDSQSRCGSYECSAKDRQCNLNYAKNPTQGPYKDFAFCTKN